MKKVLSLVLVIAMVLSSFSFAFAADFKDAEDFGDYEDAINALVALDVIQGYEDGTFKPENILTRAELAVLLVKSLGYAGLVPGAKSNFSDTQNHWSDGYVAIAFGTELVLGYPDGTFKPDQPLTYDEAITMILRAIGYVDSALKGTWPTNFKVKAIDLDLLDGVDMASAAADRGGVAQILFNALELDMMELGEENVLVKAGKLFIDNIATAGTIDVNEDVIDPNHDDYAGDVVDLEPYMFENLDVYTNDDDEVVYIKGSNSTVYEGVVDDVLLRKGVVYVDVEEADGSIEKVKFADYEVIEGEVVGDFIIEENIYENYNMRSDDYKKFIDLEDSETIKIVFNEEEVDDKMVDVLTGIIVTQQTLADQIENVYKDGRTKIDMFKLPVDEDDDVDLDQVSVKGAVDSLEDIEKDDVVVEYAAYDEDEVLVKTTLFVSRETVEGKVTRTDGEEYATIGGTKYNINAVSKLTVDLGDKGTFFLDHNGELVAADTATEAPEDYAVVLGYAFGTVNDDARIGDEFVVDEYPIMKLATQEGEVVIYDVFVEVDEDDGSLTDWATYDNEQLITSSGIVEGEAQLDFVPELFNDKDDEYFTLIKYKLNDDDQIEAIEIVEPLVKLDLDTTKSTFKLADGAVIFDSSDDYAVVKESQLDDDIVGWGVYNDDGELEVIITADVDGDDADDAIFAWVEDIELAYNADDDKVQIATVYMDGEEEELYTDDDELFKMAEEVYIEGPYKLELDGDVITKATLVEEVVDAVVTGVSVRNNMIKLQYVVEEDVVRNEWFVVAENALMMTIDANTDFDEFVDLYDVAVGDDVWFQLSDTEVGFMVLFAK